VAHGFLGSALGIQRVICAIGIWDSGFSSMMIEVLVCYFCRFSSLVSAFSSHNHMISTYSEPPRLKTEGKLKSLGCTSTERA
jgi:hypothetical protein